jgi:hypothetical protein
MIGTCRLCTVEAELRESHRIPKFVFHWLKETSPVGMRQSTNPNIRVQDGWKEHFLCGSCEALFSIWESEFSRHIFRPYHDRGHDDRATLYYADWCLPFCVSVSWRILCFSLETGNTPELSENQRAAAEEALATWRAYLLGEQPNPGAFEQHIFPIDTLESGPRQLMSPFLNRYFLRAVQEDVIANGKEVLTFAKLGRILLIGFVTSPRGWRGWKIRARKGYIAPKAMVMPHSMGVYLREQANHCGQLFASMTEKQRVAAQQGTSRAVAERMESFRAMEYDVRHTGEDAFWITRKRTK